MDEISVRKTSGLPLSASTPIQRACVHQTLSMQVVVEETCHSNVQVSKPMYQPSTLWALVPEEHHFALKPLRHR